MAPSPFKDGTYLLVTALACAGASWLAFAYFGQAVFYGLFGLSWLALGLDNARLRRTVKRLQEEKQPPP